MAPQTSLSSFHVVVVGGNFGGLSAAHKIFQSALPNSSTSPSFTYKLTIVTPNTHALYKIGVPRTIISEKIKPADALFLPFAKEFEKYGKGHFELINGMAVGIDEHGKTVEVDVQRDGVVKDGKTGQQEKLTISYGALVLTTGTTSSSPLWTVHQPVPSPTNGIIPSHHLTKASIESIRSRLPSSQTILIAGGGAVGVEVAGEIGTHFGKQGKQITLLSGSGRVLTRLKPATSQRAVNRLAKLGVSVRNNVRVVNHSIDDDKKKMTTIELSDGSEQSVDLFIDCTGGKPNSSFIPPKWLTESGRVRTDEHTLRVQSIDGQVVPGIYCVGDVSSYSNVGVIDATESRHALAYSLWEDSSKLVEPRSRGTFPVPPKGILARLMGSEQQEAIKYEKWSPDDMLVAIGPGGGTGQMKGWTLPNWFIWMIKSRTFWFEKYEPIVAGSNN